VVSLGFMVDSAKIYRVVADEAAVYGELWPAMERITREIEECSPFDVTVNSPTMITLVNPRKTSCANCADRSPVITYRLNGAMLERMGSDTGIYYTLAENIFVPAGEGFIFAASAQKVIVQMTKREGGRAFNLRNVVHPGRDIVESVR